MDCAATLHSVLRRSCLEARTLEPVFRRAQDLDDRIRAHVPFSVHGVPALDISASAKNLLRISVLGKDIGFTRCLRNAGDNCHPESAAADEGSPAMTRTRTPFRGFSTMSDGVHGGKAQLSAFTTQASREILRPKEGRQDDRITDVSN